MKMQMSDIKILKVVAGPVHIAYDFVPETGELVVLVGDYARSATPTSTMQKTKIPKHGTFWIMEDAPPGFVFGEVE